MNQWVADNELVVSKYAENLEHVDSGRKISSDPKTWVCEDSGKTENLWLNLSTGDTHVPCVKLCRGMLTFCAFETQLEVMVL